VKAHQLYPRNQTANIHQVKKIE